MIFLKLTHPADIFVVAAEPMQRKRLVLQPCSRPLESDTSELIESPLPDLDGAASVQTEGEIPSGMTEAEAKKKIGED